MCLAVVCDHKAAAKNHIIAGVDAKIVDPTNKCVFLYIVANERHDEMLKKLLLEGASPDAHDHFRGTPLHLTGRMGHGSVADIRLITTAYKGAGADGRSSPLVLAAEQGRSSTVETIFAAGADT